MHIDTIAKGYEADLLFSCPPYADLEVYSDLKEDISNMSYKEFISIYREIIRKSCNLLKNDRFAVFVVGDVRDKNGFYQNFVSDTIQAFIDSGLMLYNEMILVNAVGTLAIRSGRQFAIGRKVGKQHQNALVFYKGNPKNIKQNYPELDFSYMQDDKIICLKNSKVKRVVMRQDTINFPLVDRPESYLDTTTEVFVANGELGKVIAVGPNQTIALFSAPARLVRILHGKTKEKAKVVEGDTKEKEKEDGEDGKEDSGEEVSKFDLGYAITTHKSQGSEAKCVIVVIDPMGRSVCSREHVYTSISRAKELCVMIGKRAVCDSFCRNIALGRRKTFLVELLAKG